ncbi:hypothetical protein D3C76_1211830 [compost metagenome]
MRAGGIPFLPRTARDDGPDRNHHCAGQRSGSLFWNEPWGVVRGDRGVPCPVYGDAAAGNDDRCFDVDVEYEERGLVAGLAGAESNRS